MSSTLNSQDEVVRFLQNRSASDYAEGYRDALNQTRAIGERFVKDLIRLMPQEPEKREAFSSMVKPKTVKRGVLGVTVWKIINKAGAVGMSATDIQKLAIKDFDIPNMSIHNVFYHLGKFRDKGLVENDAGIWRVLQGPKLEAYQQALVRKEREAGFSVDQADLTQSAAE